MKLKTLLEIQKTVEERATPHDVLDFDSYHYSQSKDVKINILDLINSNFFILLPQFHKIDFL